MWDWFTSLVSDWNIGWTDVLWFAAIFLVTFTISLAEVTFLLVKLPADYFRNDHRHGFWKDRSPVWRYLGIGVKNFIGVLHIILGILLSMPGVPGQGILTILIGVMLLDLPGVRWLEKRIVCQPRVRASIDRIRARFGKPPLILEAPPASTIQTGPSGQATK